MTYKATEFSTVQDKEKFERQFKKFVESDFSRNHFPKWFYTRLSMTFGHIAHYNQSGFYAEFFTSTRDKAEFLKQTLTYPCYGQAEFTFCDVERELQAWVKSNYLFEAYVRKYKEETEKTERAEYERLQAKFGRQN
jgi:hypothetical protein